MALLISLVLIINYCYLKSTIKQQKTISGIFVVDSTEKRELHIEKIQIKH